MASGAHQPDCRQLPQGNVIRDEVPHISPGGHSQIVVSWVLQHLQRVDEAMIGSVCHHQKSAR